MAESTNFDELIRPRRRGGSPPPSTSEGDVAAPADGSDSGDQPAADQSVQRGSRAAPEAELSENSREANDEGSSAEDVNAGPVGGGSDYGRNPVVVVEDLHVRYKVYSSGKSAGSGAGRRLLTKTRGLREVHAVKGISFTAYENESIGVIGSNGSGKSTLMRSIVGLTPPASGAVFASSRPNMLGVGAALIPDLSGDKNITLGGLALGYNRKEIEQMRQDIVEFAELEDFIDLPMRTYSSGMSARLKFAIAASKQHEILIVDEALAVGDARFRKRSEARIREIREQAGTVFLVSHSMKSILDTCNRVLWINKGVLQMDGEAKEVVKAYQESKK